MYTNRISGKKHFQLMALSFMTISMSLCSLVSAQTYDTIALTGTDGIYGPGLGPNILFREAIFGKPVINNAGDIAFTGSMEGAGVTIDNRIGIWRRSSGTLTALFREGTNGPLGPGLGPNYSFGGFSKLVMNDSGDISFRAGLDGPNTTYLNDYGFWKTTNGAITPVAREGYSDGTGPGVEPGVTFELFWFDHHVFNNAGQVVIWGQLIGPGISNADNNTGLWITDGGSLTNFAREGSRGPGPQLGPGVDFSFFHFPSINHAGRVAFRAGVKGTGIDTTNNEGIWVYDGISSTVVAREGTAGPTPNAGPDVFFSAFDAPDINANDEIAFYAQLTGSTVDSTNDRGVWSNIGGTLAPVARSGAAGPGPGLGTGINFVEFGSVVMNNAGKVGFGALLTGTDINSTNNVGYWIVDQGTPELIFRTGMDDAYGPGLGDDIVFSNFGPAIMNNSGDLMFGAEISGPGVDSSNNLGIWAARHGEVVNIIRKGDLFDVDPGPGEDLRTIADGDFARGYATGAGEEDGRATSINDHGQMVFWLEFTDGSSGVFVASLTLPGDLNGDGFVGIADLNAVLSNWNQNVTPGDQLLGDANGDGFVGIADLNEVLGNWNTGTPPALVDDTAVIPEPAGLGMLIGLGVLCRGRNSLRPAA